ncbi:polysaccharide deacetylase family protein [Paenibacillus brevis]|uniref:Polysaccharide deacetylase n=1 Tax=Paenibacillus brevis TaxID=2841508 RepID=A0ABS6FRE3_9BACL|nr:polysaccharide deacetylase family protein [Paenibacillus brevis]MBU5672544.1 polysaccharide deacetylase [Paenibacillus brevis]
MINHPTSESRTTSRSQHRSGKTMKALVTVALILSSISIVMSAYATNQIIHGSKSATGAEMQTPPPVASPVTVPQVSTPKPKDSSSEGAALTEKPAVKPGTEDKSIANTGKTPASSEKTDTQSTVSAQKVVYLTFDDGPSKYTDTIVDLLQKRGIHATFFMIGSQLTDHEESVNRTIELGNYVGLHSMSHSKKKLYDSGKADPFLKEYQQEQALVNELTGTTPWLIRAPYGSKPGVNADIRDRLAEANFKMWDWTVDSKDWNYTGKPDKIIQEVKRQVHRDTEVILMHEKSQTVQALPDIIDYLQKKGYSFAVYKPEMHFPVNFAKDDRL